MEENIALSVARQRVCYFASLPTNSAVEKLTNQNGHILIEANPSEESTCGPLIMSDRFTVLRRTDTVRNSFVITNDRFFLIRPSPSKEQHHRLGR